MPEYVVNWHHALLARELDRVLAGTTRRLMIFIRRQVGKTELAGRRLPAMAFGRNPDERVIACSYADSLASATNRDVQRIIDSEDYRDLFPETRLMSKHIRTDAFGQYVRTSDYFEIVGHKGYYRSAGVGGGIAGRGATLAVVDDPVKGFAEAASPTYRQRVWEWYTHEFVKGVTGDGRIVLIMTRWHRDDLAGRLLRIEPEEWRVVCLPSLRGAVKTHPDDPREEGEALWPAYKTREVLEKEKRISPAAFAAMDQQDPSEAGGTDWPPSLFEHTLVPERLWPADFTARLVTCDPSKGKSDKAGDYSAFISLGFRDGLMWVDCEMGRIGLDRIATSLIEFCARHQPEALGIESVAFQEWLCHDVERRLRESGSSFVGQWRPIAMDPGNVKKEVRIRRLSPFIVDRKIRVKDTPGGRLLVEQLMDFPTGEHDDGPDALEMAVRLANEVCVGQ
jgi:predicted phage terminase large subunit-like protein